MAPQNMPVTPPLEQIQPDIKTDTTPAVKQQFYIRDDQDGYGLMVSGEQPPSVEDAEFLLNHGKNNNIPSYETPEMSAQRQQKEQMRQMGQAKAMIPAPVAGFVAGGLPRAFLKGAENTYSALGMDQMAAAAKAARVSSENYQPDTFLQKVGYGAGGFAGDAHYFMEPFGPIAQMAMMGLVIRPWTNSLTVREQKIGLLGEKRLKARLWALH